MPRGGRRPGAGAPRGNLNAMRGGKHSPRARAVIAMTGVHRNKRAVFIDLYERGFYPPPTYRFNGDYKGFVRYLYWKFFESSDPHQSEPIKHKQMPPLPRRLPDSASR